MKKRILASTMASVMALSAAGTSLVSSAALADFKSEVVTRAELRKYLTDKQMVALAEEGGLDDFGTYSVERFTKAYSLAQNTVDNNDATDAEITAAFQILKAAKDNLKQYSNKDLATLVETCKGVYNTDNVLNEEHNLTIYEDTPWSEFVSAYEDAEAYLESDDLRATTDAYEVLFEKQNPKKKESVTKRELEAAKKAYELALKLENKWQPWQRGTVSGSNVSNFNDKKFAWGVLYQYVASGAARITTTYQDFDEDKGITVTTDADIVAVVKVMNDAASVLNGWKADTVVSGSESKAKSTIKKYHGQLVKDFVDDDEHLGAIVDNFLSVSALPSKQSEVMVGGQYRRADSISDLSSVLGGKTGNVAGADGYWNITWSAKTTYQPLNGTKAEGYKMLDAEIKLRGAKDVFAIVTKTKLWDTNKGKLTAGNDGAYFYTSKTDAEAQFPDSTNYEVFTISKGSTTFVLSDLIDITYDDVAATDVSAQKAAVADEWAKIYAASPASAGDKKPLNNVEDGLTSVLADLKAVKASIEAFELVASPTTYTDPTVFVADVTAATDAIDDLIEALEEGSTSLKSLISAAKAAKDQASLEALTSFPTDAGTTTLIAAVSLGDLDTNGADIAGGVTAVKTALTSVATNATTLCSTTIATINVTLIGDLESANNALSAAEGVDDIDDIVVFTAQTMTVDNGSNNGRSETRTPYIYNDYCDSFLELNRMIDDIKKNGSDSYKNKFFKQPHASTNDAARIADDASNMITVANLAYAMKMVENFYRVADASKDFQEVVEDLDYITSVTDMEKITSKGQQLVCTYLTYALEDRYAASAGKTYGYRDVENLIDQAYDMQQITVDCEMFHTPHMNLVNARVTANDWLKTKDKTKPYTDKVTLVGGKTSTMAYNDLKTHYDTLNDYLKNFAYSYEDIVNKMADVAKAVDEGKGGKDLANALYDVADKFVKVQSVKLSDDTEMPDSDAITEDGVLKLNNRLYTKDGDFTLLNSEGTVAKSKGSGEYNYSHYEMKVAYEKMVDLYAKATNTETKPALVRDVNGDGTDFNLADIVALATLYASSDISKELKYDYNNDDKVDLNDIVALATEFANKV